MLRVGAVDRGVLADGQVHVLLFVVHHGGRDAGVYAGLGAHFRELFQEREVVLREVREDARHAEAHAAQERRQFVGVRVAHLADSDARSGILFRESIPFGDTPLVHRLIVQGHADGGPEEAVLVVDAVRVIEPVQFEEGHAEPLLQRAGGIHRFRVEHDVEVGFAHLVVVVEGLHGGDLVDGPDARALQQGQEVRVGVQFREEPEQIDGARVDRRSFEQGIERLADGDHRRLLALALDGVHVARDDEDVVLRFGLPADAGQVRAEERVDAGDADDDGLRLRVRDLHDLMDGLRDEAQMPAGDEVGLGHRQVEHAVRVALFGAHDRGVAPAGVRRDEQHGRLRQHEGGALDAESHRAGGVVEERRRRRVNEMTRRDELLRNLICSKSQKLLNSD